MPRKSNWTLEQQLLDSRTIETNGCWLWRNKSNRGYGKLTYHYKTLDVHRAAAHVYLGLALNKCDRKTNMVLHKCDNKNCFNPNHLYLGTQSDNIKDSVIAKTHVSSRKTHCPKGHPYNLKNTGFYKSSRFCKVCKQSEEVKEYFRNRYLLRKSNNTNL